MNHLKVHHWLHKHLKFRLKNLSLIHARIAPKLQEGLCIIFHQNTTKCNIKDLQAFDYEVLLCKSKLKDLVQISKEKNEVQACNTSYHTNMIGDLF